LRMIVWFGLVANGLLISGAWWLAGVGFGQARTLDRVLACAVLSFTWCLLGLEVLGTLGLLAIGPLVVWMGLLFAAGLVVRWLRPVPPIGHFLRRVGRSCCRPPPTLRGGGGG